MNRKNLKHVIIITALVHAAIFVGSMIPLSFGFLNPFKKGVSDYDSTDLIYCKFKDQVILMNVL